MEEKKTIQETYCRALVVDAKHAHTYISSKTPCWSWSLFAIFLIQTYKTHKKTLFLAEHAIFVDLCIFSNIAKRKGMPINVLKPELLNHGTGQIEVSINELASPAEINSQWYWIVKHPGLYVLDICTLEN